ncbi:MAG: hypothetical protein OQK98_07550 [Gammaproteobacteria bacterium]|nr:hypothetical protein [Gammaproteobacteria bacterium]
MSISYEYNSNHGYIHTKVTNTVTVKEVLSYIDSVLEDNRINKPFYELVDFSETDNFDFGYYQSEQISNKLAQLTKHKKLQGTCFVATKDIAKGMSNIFRVKNENKGIDMQIFNNINDALVYIKNTRE